MKDIYKRTIAKGKNKKFIIIAVAISGLPDDKNYAAKLGKDAWKLAKFFVSCS